VIKCDRQFKSSSDDSMCASARVASQVANGILAEPLTNFGDRPPTAVLGAGALGLPV
jgi:hypothetical protein